MRGFTLSVCLVFCAACGQKSEHPAIAASCDPQTMFCRTITPGSGSGTSANDGGSDSGSDDHGNGNGGASGDESLVTFRGQLLEFGDDYFDRGFAFAKPAQISAGGDRGSRVSTTYDGRRFELEAVLVTAVNWFLVEPEAAGTLPTLIAVDTRDRSDSDELNLGVATSDALDQIYLNSGTARSAERAQLVVRALDEQGRPLAGVRGALSAASEVTEYRMAGAWVPADAGSATDQTGMLFFGNVPSESSLTAATLTLTTAASTPSGTTSSRLDIDVRKGAVTVVNAILSER